MHEDDWSQTLARRLFEQRVVLLNGRLDDSTATRVSAELMTLDAEGDGAVSLADRLRGWQLGRSRSP